REALDAVRAVWPERLPMTIRLGSDDFNEEGVVFEDAVWAVDELKGHGLDLADLSLGMNSDVVKDVPFNEVAFMVERGARVRREVGIPVGVSWNLGLPAVADRVIRQDLIDLVFLGRPALANPHWPVWAARELAHNDPFSLIPQDWSWWLRNHHDQSCGINENGSLCASSRAAHTGQCGLASAGRPRNTRSIRSCRITRSATAGSPRFQLTPTGMPTSRRTRAPRSTMNATSLNGTSFTTSLFMPRLRSARSSPCLFNSPTAHTASSNTTPSSLKSSEPNRIVSGSRSGH